MKITFSITIMEKDGIDCKVVETLYKTIESDNVPTNNNELILFFEDEPSFAINYIRRFYHKNRPCDVFVKLQSYKTEYPFAMIRKLRDNGWEEMK